MMSPPSRKPIRNAMRFIALIALTAGALWLLVATGVADADGPDDPPPASAKDGKVSSALLDALADATRPVGAAGAAGDPGPDDPPEDALEQKSDVDLIRIDRSGRVQVYVHVRSTSPESLATLRRNGLEIELFNEDAGIVQGWLAPADIEGVAARANVRRVGLPNYAVPRVGAKETAGDGIHRSRLLRQLTDYTGAGVSVGVISNGAGFHDAAHASGDLPATLEIDPERPGCQNCAPEGTAMLEIVHDMAPGAELSFSGPSTDLQMAQSIRWLAYDAFDGEGTDVIVDDLGYIQPYFEDGILAKAVDEVVQAGRIYVSATGNDAHRHYGGQYVDGGNGYHDFGGGDTTMRIDARSSATLFLQWNDPFGASGNDFDIYGCEPGSRPTPSNLESGVCRKSAGFQNGDDDPAETLFVPETEAMDILIHAYDVDPDAPHQLKILALGGVGFDEHNVASGSIFGHPAAAGAIAAAAASAATPDTIEYYSSRGPTEIYFPHRETRLKPDLTGTAGIDVTGVGGFSTLFRGTSAAAPHVAAIAALALKADRRARPGSSRRDALRRVYEALTRGAVDLGEPGHDSVFGWGRADALGAVELLAGAQTFSYIVDSTGDGADSDPTDGICDDGSGRCTLRAAIRQANAEGRAVIRFDIPGNGPHSIRPASPLPMIAGVALVDGGSQPAGSGGHRAWIELDGSAAGAGANGLTLIASGSEVSGLAINRFAGHGIVIWALDGVVVRDNFIGTDTTGRAARGNGGAGVLINNSPSNVVTGNVISANGSHGVHVTGAGSGNTRVSLNYIGVDAAGNADLGNAGSGVRISGGAANVVADNLISGNDGHGVSLEGNNARDAEITNNRIGTNADATADLGNALSGVHVNGTPGGDIRNNTVAGNDGNGVSISGASAAQWDIVENRIGSNDDGADLGNSGAGIHFSNGAQSNPVAYSAVAFNGGDGIAVTGDASSGNVFLSNRIHSNAGLGIDLGDDGVTANDAGDADTGPNGLQNYPVISQAVIHGQILTATWNIDANPGAVFEVEFYANQACDGASNGEGQQPIGRSVGLVNSADNADFLNTVFGAAAITGRYVSATATQISSSGSGTSEFSPCVAASILPGITLSDESVRVDEGGTASYTVSLTEQPAADVVVQTSLRIASGNFIHPADPSEISITPDTLTFTAENWSIPQTVTVAAGHDSDAADRRAFADYLIARDGQRYRVGLVRFAIVDDDAPGFVPHVADLPVLRLPNGLLRVPEGGTATYQARLDEQPAGDVVVNIAGSDGNAVTVTPSTLTFTTENWNTAQTVTLRGQQDNNAVDTKVLSITHTVTIDGYDHVVGVIGALVVDDERPALALPDALTVAEGASAQYDVRLSALPSANVVIRLDAPRGGPITAQPSSLTFTPVNWNVPQTVTVTAVQDEDGNDAMPSIRHSVRAPDGQDYFIAALPVTVSDDDTAPYFPEGAAASRDISEHAPAGSDVGRPVAADDPTGAGLHYDISGTDTAPFRIDPVNGQISVAPGVVLDFENPSDTDTDNRYLVTVQARNAGGETDAIAVTIRVLDTPEDGPAPPTAPSDVTISLPASNPDAGLMLEWTPVDDGTGNPAPDYDLRWRASHATQWEQIDYTLIGGSSVTALGLESGIAYQMQVRAVTARSAGGWSPAVTGRTTTAANDPPFFSAGTPETTREIPEDAAAGTAVGAPIAAVDAESDPLTYSLSGADAALFDLDPATGQLTVAAGAALDYETAPQLSVTVSVTDGRNAAGGADPAIDATIAVAIRVIDANEERAALVALYHATGGPDWKRSNDWNSQRELSQWAGVFTDAAGRVNRLYLSDNNLSGTLPAELGSLTALQNLELIGNNLTGPLPAELGNLVNLKVLTLEKNAGLSGPLPLELTNLTNLSQFRFHDTGLCAPPDRAFQDWLRGVDYFTGGHCPAEDRAALVAFYQATGGNGWRSRVNWLTDRPLGEWAGVTVDADGRVTGLSLPDNNLTGAIPAQLQNLERLQTLDLSRNNLSGTLPAWLGNLSNLQTLDLTLNNLDGPVPQEIGNLSNLVELHLVLTRLSGELPQSLTRLTNLKRLTFSSGLYPPDNDDFMEWLRGLEFCPEQYCPPPDRAALTAFYHAMGGENWTSNDGWLSHRPLGRWHGVTTDADGRVVNLSLIDNNLAGTLPADLGKMKRLEVLALDRNALTGAVPTELGQLQSLTRLALNRNQLTGAIPTELGSLPNLGIIGLARNSLSGSLPSSLGNLTGLTRLSLHDNNALSGPLPSGFTNLANLQRLAVANTGLCAPDDEAFDDWLDTVDDLTPSAADFPRCQ